MNLTRLLFGAVMLIGGVISGQAQIIAYSNIADYDGAYSYNGGITGYAVSGSPITTSGSHMFASNYSSVALFDDITPLSALAGQTVDSITYSVYDGLTYNTPSVVPTLYFYNDDGANGGPGTLIASYTLPATVYANNSASLYTLNLGSTGFTLPSTTFWAGIAFDVNVSNENDAPNAASEAGAFGQAVYGTPTVGTSSSASFYATEAFPGGSNPGGSLTTYPPNFAWQFQVAPVPEPSTWAMMLGGLVLLGQARYRRRPFLE
jgi:hypothetical protein